MRRISSMTRSSAASASLKSPASSSTASNNDSIRSRSPGCAPSLLTSSSSLRDLAAISSLLPQGLGAYSLTPHQFESHPTSTHPLTFNKDAPVGKEVDLLVNYPRAKRNVEDRGQNKTE